tara:strand:+ start:135 stop:482 length:348 start_codon:yes stop_codon:yes gene_type:complete
VSAKQCVLSKEAPIKARVLGTADIQPRREERFEAKFFAEKRKNFKKLDPACSFLFSFLFSFQASFFEAVSFFSLVVSLSLLLVFDFTTIQTTIDTDDAQEERETTGITRQKERAD